MLLLCVQDAAYTFSWVPGLRVISFPSPLCLTYNFWLWMDFSDPGLPILT